MSDDEGESQQGKLDVPEPLNNYGVSALLHYAAAAGDIEECYRLIIEEGASWCALNSTRSTPLHIAAGKGYYPMVEMLLDVEEQLRKPNEEPGVKRKESPEIGGYIPLICAVKGNHIQIAELLLAKGANVNECDINKMTSLHYCARLHDHNDMAKLLLAKGADPELKDENGYNCSFWAKEMNNSGFLALKGIPGPEAPDVMDLVELIKARKEAYEASLGGGKKADDGGGKKKRKKK